MVRSTVVLGGKEHGLYCRIALMRDSGIEFGRCLSARAPGEMICSIQTDYEAGEIKLTAMIGYVIHSVNISHHSNVNSVDIAFVAKTVNPPTDQKNQ